MAISYCCILLAAMMPLILAGYAKFSSKGYDNSSPREFLSKLEGRAKRANFAQLNSFEAFPVFAVSIIIAHLAGVAQSLITIIAVFYIIFRILYAVCYILDNHALRSTVWFLAFACVIILFISSILRS